MNILTFTETYLQTQGKNPEDKDYQSIVIDLTVKIRKGLDIQIRNTKVALNQNRRKITCIN